MNGKWRALALSSVLGICFFLLIFYLSGTEIGDVKAAFCQAGLGALVLVALAMTMQLFLQAISWIVLLGPEHRMTFSQAISAIYIGWAANFITPSLYLGGEPIRAYALSKSSGLLFRKALGSVFVHKFLEFASFIVYILVCAVLVFYRYRREISPRLQAAIFLCVLVLATVFLALMIAIFSRKRFFSFSAKLSMRWGIACKFLGRNLHKIAEMEDFILQAFFTTPGRCIHSLAWMLIFHLLVLVRPLMFFMFTRISLGISELALLFLMIQMLLALQFTPGGIGILEGGMIGVFALIQIPPAQALGFASFCRAGDLLTVAVGAAIPLYYRMTRNRPVEKE